MFDLEGRACCITKDSVLHELGCRLKRVTVRTVDLLRMEGSVVTFVG